MIGRTTPTERNWFSESGTDKHYCLLSGVVRVLTNARPLEARFEGEVSGRLNSNVSVLGSAVASFAEKHEVSFVVSTFERDSVRLSKQSNGDDVMYIEASVRSVVAAVLTDGITTTHSSTCFRPSGTVPSAVSTVPVRIQFPGRGTAHLPTGFPRPGNALQGPGDLLPDIRRQFDAVLRFGHPSTRRFRKSSVLQRSSDPPFYSVGTLSTVQGVILTTHFTGWNIESVHVRADRSGRDVTFVGDLRLRQFFVPIFDFEPPTASIASHHRR
jgi:hypothetical protein